MTLYGDVSTRRNDPPNRVPGVYGDRRRGRPPHWAGSPPGMPGAGLQREWAIGAGCPCLLRPAERVFQGLRPLAYKNAGKK